MRPNHLRLRQIALVAADLAAARADIAAVLGVEYAYADPGVGKYGLHNAVFPLGDTFLEVVSPKEEGTTAGRLLEKRGGDGGYMVILQVDDLIDARARLQRVGARVADQTPPGDVAFTHVHPKDIGGAILSIDYMNPPTRWEWGGPSWEENADTRVSKAIVGAQLQADDPAKMAARWAEVLGRTAERDGDIWRITLDEGTIRFGALEDGRGEGLSAFDVVVANADAVRARARARGLLDGAGEVVLCGTRVVLVET